MYPRTAAVFPSESPYLAEACTALRASGLVVVQEVHKDLEEFLEKQLALTIALFGIDSCVDDLHAPEIARRIGLIRPDAARVLYDQTINWSTTPTHAGIILRGEEDGSGSALVLDAVKRVRRAIG